MGGGVMRTHLSDPYHPSDEAWDVMELDLTARPLQLARTIARVIDEATARAFWRGVTAERACCEI